MSMPLAFGVYLSFPPLGSPGCYRKAVARIYIDLFRPFFREPRRVCVCVHIFGIVSPRPTSQALTRHRSVGGHGTALNSLMERQHKP